MVLEELDANKRYDKYFSGPKHIEHSIKLEGTKKWIRAKIGQELIIDSKNAFILLENGHLPIYYFGKNDINMKFLKKNDFVTTCPYKGEATYWDLFMDDRKVNNIAWSYENPIKDQEEIRGLLAFYWKNIDSWYEEEERIYSYPKDPYVRLDTIRSSRKIEIFLENQLIASTNKSIILFETHKEPVYFIAIKEIDTNLVFSNRILRCPYKGLSNYLSVKNDNKIFKDVCLQYTEPNPEVSRIRNLICFKEKYPISIKVDNLVIGK